MGGAINCGAPSPARAAAVSHGCPSALFRGVNVLNTVLKVVDDRAAARRQHRFKGSGQVWPGVDETMVLVNEKVEATLRWAALDDHQRRFPTAETSP